MALPSGVSAKIERAKAHINDAESIARTYNADAYEVFAQHNGETDQRLTRCTRA